MKRYREHDVTSDLLAEPLQKVFELENDKINLLEFIKRIRESGKWTIDGLKFYEINYDDLLGTKKINEVGGYVQGRNVLPNDENEDLLSARDKLISELQGKVNYYDSFGNIDSLAKDLKCKTQECESLRQSMVDMRQALTEEVAAKHDIILALKKDCQQLEERCMQADKQTAFKDDIIKELRKEIKQLKQQPISLDNPKKRSHFPERPPQPSLCKEHKNEFSFTKTKDQNPFLSMNHTRRSIESGKSTVIVIHKDSTGKREKSHMIKGTYECIYKEEERKTFCPYCKQNVSNAKTKSATKDFNKTFARGESQSLQCKSENDLLKDMKNNLKPIKDRSKFTSTALTRSKTFVDRTSVLKPEQDEKVSERKVCVPNHIPVKMYVNNIELQKKS